MCDILVLDFLIEENVSFGVLGCIDWQIITSDSEKRFKISWLNLDNSQSRSKMLVMLLNGRMEKISWTNRVRNELMSCTGKEDTNNISKINRRKANWTGHILQRNCLLKHMTDWKLEGIKKWGEDEKGEVSSYRMTSTKRDGIGNWKMKHEIAFYVKFAF